MLKSLNIFLVSFVFLFGQNAMALEQTSSKDRVKVEKEFDFDTLDPAETCLDEFRRHRNGLIGWNSAAPLGGAIATFGIMFLGVRIDQFLNPGAFLAGLGGMVVGFLVGAGIYGVTQSILIYKLVKDAVVINAIKDSYTGLSKVHSRWAKKLNKKYGPFKTPATSKAVRSHLLELDSSLALCDGSLVSKRRARKFNKRGKAKYGLAYKKDILKYLKTKFE